MSRTNRKVWLVAVGAFCCACTLSACRHTDGQAVLPARLGQIEPDTASQPEEKLSFAAPVSRELIRGSDPTPYHALPTPPPAAAEEPADVRHAAYPFSTEKNSLLLDPPPSTEPAAEGSVVPTPAVAPQVIHLDKTEEAASPAESPLLVALRCFLDKQPARAMEVLQKYDKPNQEMFLCLLPLAAKLAETSLNKASSGDITTMADLLESMRQHLPDRTKLAIDKMVFCERIQDFGRYTPLEKNHVFHPSTHERPGELVQIYVELNNLSSKPRDKDKYFETEMASTVDITVEGDKRSRFPNDFKGWHYDFNDRHRVILSQTRRHDFYNKYSFYVPHIPPGRYLLTIHVTDMLARPRQIASSTKRFEVSNVGRPRYVSAQ